MDCIAHRGFAGVEPENTLPAVRAAVKRADGVEVDVRRCGSGEPVVCHDETVDRTTDGTGPVAAHTAAELGALSVGDSGAGVPTFADILAAVPADVTLYAELKERGLGSDMTSLASAADAPVAVSSFDADALREVDEVLTALIAAEADGLLDRAVSLGCVAVHPHHELATPAFVDRAHGASLAVNAWTVTEASETRRLRETGVDGVITDFPGCCPSYGRL